MTRCEIIVAIDDLDYASETPDQPLKAVRVGSEVGSILGLQPGATMRLWCGDSEFDVSIDENLPPEGIEL